MQNNNVHMLAALDAAKKGQGFCAPNPAVGAVVVRNGQIVAIGYHRGPGLPHAEVEALSLLQEDLSDCELYITLEPCCHHGRTPPCTDLIITSGVAKVFFGLFDPNPQVAGQGQKQLQKAGIVCEYLQSEEVDNFYRAYRYWWKNKMPWVTTKLAIDSQHNVAIDTITGPECQLYTHQERLRHDALLTTIKTILHDDPQYNARLIDASIKKPLFILDAHAKLPLSAKVLTTCHPVTIFYHNAPANKIKNLEEAGVCCIEVPLKNKRLDLNVCLKKIAGLGVHALWVESGWMSTAAFISQGLANEMLFYVAPGAKDVQVKRFDFIYEPHNERHIEFSYLGNDVLVRIASRLAHPWA